MKRLTVVLANYDIELFGIEFLSLRMPFPVPEVTASSTDIVGIAR